MVGRFQSDVKYPSCHSLIPLISGAGVKNGNQKDTWFKIKFNKKMKKYFWEKNKIRKSFATFYWQEDI